MFFYYGFNNLAAERPSAVVYGETAPYGCLLVLQCIEIALPHLKVHFGAAVYRETAPLLVHSSLRRQRLPYLIA